MNGKERPILPPENLVKVVLFDTFGTIVDWRTSITKEITTIAARKGLTDFDGDAFARAWRAGYAPGMAAVTAGKRPFVSIDVIHRERLDAILPAFGLSLLTESERADLNNAWHRLSPWPDSCAGLARIKAKFMIGPLSNGSLLLLAHMAKRAGLPSSQSFAVEINSLSGGSDGHKEKACSKVHHFHCVSVKFS